MQLETKACRHGKLSYFADDMYIGKSLRLYGDYSEGEVNAFGKLLWPDNVCVEVGSNIGALTVPLARLCKRVLAFEPQPENFELLCRNIRQNGIENVRCLQMAVGCQVGGARIASLGSLGHLNYGCVELGKGDNLVHQTTLDEALDTEDHISFIKMDCEGSELDALKGAETIIHKHKPILYIENDRDDQSSHLVGWLIDHDYDCFWHRVPLFTNPNFFGEKTNIFGIIHSHMMICIPTGDRNDRHHRQRGNTVRQLV